MKQVNFVIEALESLDGKRTYVIRELVGNQPPQTLAVCSTGEEIAQFFNDFKIK